MLKGQKLISLITMELKSNYLKDKKIVIGVTSSIAAVEVIKLIRELKRHGAVVYCILTEEAKKIIGIESLRFAADEVFEDITGDVEHVQLYEKSDLLIICPATANIISKISLKIADNLVNTTALMFLNFKPVIIVPAMHLNMLKNIEEHLNNLKKCCKIISPRIEEGKAKFPDYKEIVKEVINTIENKFDKKVLILNGATAEFIDDVRVITNLSSGKFGKALAEEFSKDFYVEIIQGLGEYPYYIKVHKVLTVEEMLNKAISLAKNFDVILSPAAISDFTVDKIEGKLSSDNEVTLKLKRAPKILKELRKRYKDKIIVGFKAEYNLSEKELI